MWLKRACLTGQPVFKTNVNTFTFGRAFGEDVSYKMSNTLDEIKFLLKLLAQSTNWPDANIITKRWL